MQAPTFRNDDEAALYYLGVLRDGTDAEKIVARDRLAVVFEHRGLYAEAVELYERNVRAGVRSTEFFARLSEAYRQMGDAGSADAAMAEARRMYAAQQAGTEQRKGVPFPPSSRPDTDQDGTLASVVSPPDRPVRRGGPPGRGVSVGDQYTDTSPLPVQTPADVASPEAPAQPRRAKPANASAELALDEPPDAEPNTSGAAAAAVATAEAEQPARPAWPRPSGPRRPSGLLAIVGIVLFMIVLPVALLALLVVNPMMLYLEGKAAGPKIDAHEDTPARLKIVPGWTAAWYLRDGRSVTGLWSTSGLELTLDEGSPDAGQSFTVAPSMPQPWGETITVVERRGEGRASQETTIPASFRVPADLPTSGGPLRARISGAVTAPRLTESGQFATMSDAIDRPVELVAVSVPELLLDRFVNSVGMYTQEDRWLLVTIGALLCWCFLAGAAAVAARLRSSATVTDERRGP
jgi:hypothetical protein